MDGGGEKGKGGMERREGGERKEWEREGGALPLSTHTYKPSLNSLPMTTTTTTMIGDDDGVDDDEGGDNDDNEKVGKEEEGDDEDEEDSKSTVSSLSGRMRIVAGFINVVTS